MDAVQIGDTCERLKRQGMPDNLAVIHAITLSLTLVQTDNDGRYVKITDLPATIEHEVKRVLLKWTKQIFAPIGAGLATLWMAITHWDNVTSFFRSLTK